MADTTFIVPQNIFKAYHPPISAQSIHENALTDAILQRFLSSCQDGAVGVAPVYGARCTLVMIAFSTLSHVLLVRLSGSSAKSQKPKKNFQTLTGRELLRDHILCHPQRQLYGFKMDKIAIALYLDLSLCVRAGADLLSISKKSNRHSLDAILQALGGELTLHKEAVKALFRHREGDHTLPTDAALQAWAACRASSLSSMQRALLAIPRIDTQGMLDTHLAAFAKISRDSDRLDALKPTQVKNEVKADFSYKKGGINVTSTRFRTRIMRSQNQTIQIKTDKSATVTGRAKKVEGRGARIAVEGPVIGTKIVSITTFGKEEPTHAEAQREMVVLYALQRRVSLSSQPFFQAIWLPTEKPIWPTLPARRSKPIIYTPSQALNTSQDLAVQKILSDHDQDRIVVIQGPPGTGKTTVIAASVTSII
ncbi:hypothetical protein BV22DRAFT_973466, partial [Leucogyrophana mollusca]